MIETHSLKVPRTARYFLAAPRGPAASEHWYLIHGYGQLAADFLSSLENLRADHRLLIAPEGLSRFYTRGMGGTPGASWMTSEDRKAEINDYLHYLDTLRAHIAGEHGVPERVVVLGFSQGVATASRWVASRNGPSDALICWAGEMASELSDLAQSFGEMPVVSVRGTTDPLLQEDWIQRERERLVDAGLQSAEITFEGGHRIEAGAALRASTMVDALLRKR